ncbi:MAG: hypothetical protein QF681_20300, partial [Vicinamibacterales bacterium]|nr:hypothetical protein [Vicinamibacterales bacterium]
TTRLLVNTGGSPRSYDITDIPAWLSVEPRSGTILPGSQQSVTFTVDGPQVGAGSLLETVFASGSLGDEPRLVDIRVLCPPPEWGTVNPAAYQHSMSITATVSTDADTSDDVFDRVGVFIDGELRSVEEVQFVEGLVAAGQYPYEVFLTVYGNGSEDAGKELEIRVWDASAC